MEVWTRRPSNSVMTGATPLCNALRSAHGGSGASQERVGLGLAAMGLELSAVGPHCLPSSAYPGTSLYHRFREARRQDVTRREKYSQSVTGHAPPPRASRADRRHEEAGGSTAWLRSDVSCVPGAQCKRRDALDWRVGHYAAAARRLSLGSDLQWGWLFDWGVLVKSPSRH